MALELAGYDLLPQNVPSFARGFCAALMATSLCYPLDTLRWVRPADGGKDSTSRLCQRRMRRC